MRSSTFSSEERPLPTGPPWALGLALVLLAIVELALRQIPVSDLIPYDNGATEYHAVARFLETVGPAEISVIGSSRAREAIVASEVSRLCQARLGRSVSVANYACSGARATENEALVEFLLARGQPKLLLYGVSPRQLLERDEPREQFALFWDWPAWWRHYRQDPQQIGKLLPVVIRNTVGQWYRTLRYRRKAAVVVHDLLIALRAGDVSSRTLRDLAAGRYLPSPPNGQRSRWHASRPDLSLVQREVSEERVRLYVQRLLYDGKYFIEGTQPQRVQHIISMCNQAGVKLALVEVPLNDLLLRHLPPGAHSVFRATMRSLADAGGVTFVASDEFDVEFTDHEFLDQSHLNYRGALRYTQALFDRVITLTTGQREFPD